MSDPEEEPRVVYGATGEPYEQHMARLEAGRIDQPAAQPQSSGMDERLAKLEGAYDSLKVVRPMTLTVIAISLSAVSILLAALVFVLGTFSAQLSAVTTKVDAIPQRLSEEFRAMRAEMAAQTSAIANSITAVRQVQPPAPAPPPTPPPGRPLPSR